MATAKDDNPLGLGLLDTGRSGRTSPRPTRSLSSPPPPLSSLVYVKIPVTGTRRKVDVVFEKEEKSPEKLAARRGHYSGSITSAIKQISEYHERLKRKQGSDSPTCTLLRVSELFLNLASVVDDLNYFILLTHNFICEQEKAGEAATVFPPAWAHQNRYHFWLHYEAALNEGRSKLLQLLQHSGGVINGRTFAQLEPDDLPELFPEPTVYGALSQPASPVNETVEDIWSYEHLTDPEHAEFLKQCKEKRDKREKDRAANLVARKALQEERVKKARLEAEEKSKRKAQAQKDPAPEKTSKRTPEDDANRLRIAQAKHDADIRADILRANEERQRKEQEEDEAREKIAADEAQKKAAADQAAETTLFEAGEADQGVVEFRETFNRLRQNVQEGNRLSINSDLQLKKWLEASERIKAAANISQADKAWLTNYDDIVAQFDTDEQAKQEEGQSREAARKKRLDNIMDDNWDGDEETREEVRGHLLQKQRELATLEAPTAEESHQLADVTRRILEITAPEPPAASSETVRQVDPFLTPLSARNRINPPDSAAFSNAQNARWQQLQGENALEQDRVRLRQQQQQLPPIRPFNQQFPPLSQIPELAQPPQQRYSYMDIPQAQPPGLTSASQLQADIMAPTSAASYSGSMTRQQPPQPRRTTPSMPASMNPPRPAAPNWRAPPGYMQQQQYGAPPIGPPQAPPFVQVVPPPPAAAPNVEQPAAQGMRQPVAAGAPGGGGGGPPDDGGDPGRRGGNPGGPPPPPAPGGGGGGGGPGGPPVPPPGPPAGPPGPPGPPAGPPGPPGGGGGPGGYYPQPQHPAPPIVAGMAQLGAFLGPVVQMNYDITKKVTMWNGNQEMAPFFFDQWNEQERMLMTAPEFLYNVAQIFNEMLRCTAAKAREIVLSQSRRPTWEALLECKTQLWELGRATDNEMAKAVREMKKELHTKVTGGITGRNNWITNAKKWTAFLRQTEAELWMQIWTRDRLSIEPNLDDVQARAWTAYRAKLYNPASLMLYDDSMAHMINCMELLSLKESSRLSRNLGQIEGRSEQPQKKFHKKVTWVNMTRNDASSSSSANERNSPELLQIKYEGTVAATPAGTPLGKKKPNYGDKKSTDGFIPCCFCASQKGYEQRAHKFPRQCKLLTDGSPMTPDAAKSVAIKAKVCNCCLSPGHFATSCTAPPTVGCRVDGCKGRHHSIFHPRGGDQQRRPPSTQSQGRGGGRGAASSGRGRGGNTGRTPTDRLKSNWRPQQ